MPPRAEYELTDLGRTLREPLTALGRWAEQHFDEVDAALDDARERFGGGAVTRASVLGPRRDVNALPTNPRLPRTE